MVVRKNYFKQDTGGIGIAWCGVLIVSLLLILPNILLLLYEREDISAARSGELLGEPLFLWLILLVLVRVRYFLWLVLPILWVMPLEAIYVVLYGRPTDAHIFGILSDTSFDEAFQFIKKYLFYTLAYVVGITWGVAFFSSRSHKVLIPMILKRSVLLGGGILFTCIGIGNYMLAKQNAIDGLVSSHSMLFEMNYSLAESVIVDIFPFGLWVRYSEYRHQIEQMEVLQKKNASFRFGAKVNTYKRKEIYVLVIGETARSKNLSLNGYERETTPLLSRRKNIVSFSNMISGWLWTRMSVPVILTRKTVDNKNIYFPEKSIVSLFSEAGFDTYWLSMQSPYGFHDSPIALHSREAAHTKFLNPADYKGSGFYDGVILPHLENAMVSNKNLFIVLHLLGSHFNYRDRYPDAFDIFQPSMKQKDVALQDRHEKVRLLNSYDNSLLYTDYFLNQVINIVDSQHAVSAVFYVSDHGEVIFDGECEKSGHGHHTEYDHMNASVLWVSDGYINKNPEKYARAFSKKQSPLSTTDIFYSLAGMAGIKYANEDSTRDIFSELWSPHSRILQNGLDFDLSDRSGACKEIVRKK